jgi:hypothetical protein
MGFIGKMPASELSALYDTRKGELILYAEGDVMEASYGYQFRRLNYAGGLLFELIGGTGPMTGKMGHYTHTQKFAMKLPLPHFASDVVTIQTANNPKGEQVKIYYTGFGNGISEYGLTAAEGTKAEALLTTNAPLESLPGHDNLIVLQYTPFTITAPANAGAGGEVFIKYNQEFITLQTAGIRNENIVWTFQTNKVGTTEVLVTTSMVNPSLVIVQTYDVQVIPPFAK